MVSQVVTPTNLGSEFDIGVIEANKIHIKHDASITLLPSGQLSVNVSASLPNKCSGGKVAASDTVMVQSPTALTALGTTNALLAVPQAGGCPAIVQLPATCTTPLPAAFGNAVLAPIDATGNIGLARVPSAQRPSQKTVTAAYTIDPIADSTILANANAGSFSVTLPTVTVANLCHGTRFTVKRIDNNPLTNVRVLGSAIDGSPGNSIQLGTSSRFGTLTGEGAAFEWDVTANTWRIVAAF